MLFYRALTDAELRGDFPLREALDLLQDKDPSRFFGEALQGITEALEIRPGIDPVAHGMSDGRCVVSALLPRGSQGIVGSLDTVQREVFCRLVKIGSGMSNLSGENNPAQANVGLLDDVFDVIGRHDLRYYGPDALPHR